MYMIPSDNFQRFFDFVSERHAIYMRRERGDPWPWTNDEILQKYKFVNVFRELDTGTVYCRKVIREPFSQHPELFFNIASYRLYNLIDTHKEIGFIEDYEEQKDDIINIVRARLERGDRVFTGAHMITGTLGGDKIHQVFELCLGRLWENRRELEPREGDTLRMAFDRINGNATGYGPFISYEVVTDLRHTRYLENALDVMTWANPGPGAQRGINRLLGNVVKTKKTKPTKEDRAKYPSYDGYIQIMRHLLTRSPVYVKPWVPSMEMRDIEHSLCEWDKHERARLGQGRPRSRYIPPHERK